MPVLLVLVKRRLIHNVCHSLWWAGHEGHPITLIYLSSLDFEFLKLHNASQNKPLLFRGKRCHGSLYWALGLSLRTALGIRIILQVELPVLIQGPDIIKSQGGIKPGYWPFKYFDIYASCEGCTKELAYDGFINKGKEDRHWIWGSCFCRGRISNTVANHRVNGGLSSIQDGF